MTDRRLLWGCLSGALSALVAGLATWIYLTWLIVPDDGLEALMFLPILGLLAGGSAAVLSYGRTFDEAARVGTAVFAGAVGGTVAFTFALGVLAGEPAMVGFGFGQAAAMVVAPFCLAGCTVGLVASKLVGWVRR